MIRNEHRKQHMQICKHTHTQTADYCACKRVCTMLGPF